ncbi:hypothetical protein SKA34_10700 [Photobacterium sp. SKA34]|uniref:hypothetical protein n=1 Tax=Photobacterium sp. SKA34 TaxID=121723 RepID=UPI00006ABED1|nr:hypothetical protein [Photobacterium sp. SKA34]EAR53375.1 hypothetical protein SKA34_10700 [Photobacterium sp. SKA34]
MFKKNNLLPIAISFAILPLSGLLQAQTLQNNLSTINYNQTEVIDVNFDGEVTSDNLYLQMNSAIATLNGKKDNTKLILHVPGGKHILSSRVINHTKGVISLDQTVYGNRIFELQGSTNKHNPTKLYIDQSAYFEHTIFGNSPSNFTFSHLEFHRTGKTMSEGIITDVGKGYVDIKLLDGFPEIGSIYNDGIPGGRYLRLITDDINNPEISPVDQGQEPWGRDNHNDHYLAPEALDAPLNRNWRIFIANPDKTLTSRGYKKGLWVAVKSKSYNYAYNFQGMSTNITFDHVDFYDSTMGQMHGGAKNITLKNVKFGRGDRVNGVVPAFASSAGGPQFVGYEDGNKYENILLDHVWLEYTGDDNFSAQAASQGSSFKLDHVYSKGAFARLLLANKDAFGVCLTDSVVLNGQPAVVHEAINKDIEHFEFKEMFSVCQD